MPSVNIYTPKEKVKSIDCILPKFRGFLAQELSCGDRKLAGDEISLRIIPYDDRSLTISDTELEIKAYSYPERVQRQDEICLSVQDYIQRTCPKAGSVYVWLQLSELGHSSKK